MSLDKLKFKYLCSLRLAISILVTGKRAELFNEHDAVDDCLRVVYCLD